MCHIAPQLGSKKMAHNKETASSIKGTYEQREHAFDMSPEKERNLVVDYSGAQTVRSPEETRLVRKFDFWIMVSTL